MDDTILRPRRRFVSHTTTRFILRLILVAALLAGAARASAQMDGGEVSSASLVAPTRAVAPGQTVLLGLRFELDDGWHIYWNGRNDTGFPPEVAWEAGEGVEVGPLVWPAPERYVSPGGILDHVYEGDPVIFVPVTIAPDLRAGQTVRLGGRVDWLVCKDICLPASGRVEIELRVSTTPQPPVHDPDTPFARWLARLPEPVTAAGVPGLSVTWQGNAVTLRYKGARRLALYPLANAAPLRDLLGQAQADGPMLRLELDSDSGLPDSSGGRLVGVLAIEGGGEEDGHRWLLLDAGPDGLRTPPGADQLRRARAHPLAKRD